MTQPQAQSSDLGSLYARLMTEAREHKRQEQVHRRAAQEKRRQIDALRGVFEELGISVKGTVERTQP